MIKATVPTGVGLAVLLAIGVPACSSASAANPRHTLTGSVEVIDANDEPFTPGQACDGSDTGGYSDLSAGADVTVKNGSGKIVAVGSLREGKPNYDGATCTMPLRVSGVPKASFYQVEVSHRGNLTYSYKQLQNRHWRVSLTIGG